MNRLSDEQLKEYCKDNYTYLERERLMAAELLASRKAIEVLREGLEFYGALNSWMTVTASNRNQRFCIMKGQDLEYFQEPNQDSYCGRLAREALSQADKILRGEE